jgi:hypothetical protein
MNSRTLNMLIIIVFPFAILHEFMHFIVLVIFKCKPKLSLIDLSVKPTCKRKKPIILSAFAPLLLLPLWFYGLIHILQLHVNVIIYIYYLLQIIPCFPSTEDIFVALYALRNYK